PIPATVASNKTAKQPAQTAAQKQAATVPGMEATTANATQSPPASQALVKNEKPAAAPLTSPSVETPVASNALPSETRAPLPPEPEQKAPVPVVQQSPSNVLAISPSNKVAPPITAANVPAQNSPSNRVPPPIAATNVSATPATVLAPATVNLPESEGTWNWRTWVVGGLLVAGILLLVWVVISEMRRRVSGTLYRSPTPATGPRFDAPEEATVVEKLAAPKRLAGGPPQVSLQLKASEPSVRRSAVPFGKTNRPLGATVSSAAGVGAVIENFVPRQPAAIPEPERFEEPVIESAAESAVSVPITPESDYSRDFMPETVSEVSEIISAPEPEPEPEVVSEKSEIAPSHEEEAPVAPAFEEAPVFFEPPITWAPVTAQTTSTEPAEF